MEDFEIMIRDMNKHIKTADHLLYMTYPLVKDNKLIITIADNLFLSLKKAVEAILYYDRLYKRISMYPENFNSKLEIFKNKCATRHNIDKKYVELIEEVYNLLEERKKSSMEFIRNDRYVFFSNATRTKSISIEKLKTYIANAKPFVQKINRIYYEHATGR